MQYGRVKKRETNGTTQVSQNELLRYYQSYNGSREINYKERLGQDLNWALSFDQYKEAETTKHVHRLHPYKGKFIPQLVEYFWDEHTDSFKKEVYFQRGDIVLDPFSGSGTTMVQACELGIHALGIDVSAFNALMGNCKITHYDQDGVQDCMKAGSAATRSDRITQRIRSLHSVTLPAFIAKNNLAHLPAVMLPNYEVPVITKT